MKNLKLVFAVALVTISGAALAEMIYPFYNGASVYDPSTGQYDHNGCGAATFYGNYGATTPIPALLNNTSTLIHTGPSSHWVQCNNGTMFASGDSYEGYMGL